MTICHVPPVDFLSCEMFINVFPIDRWVMIIIVSYWIYLIFQWLLHATVLVGCGDVQLFDPHSSLQE